MDSFDLPSRGGKPLETVRPSARESAVDLLNRAEETPSHGGELVAAPSVRPSREPQPEDPRAAGQRDAPPPSGRDHRAGPKLGIAYPQLLGRNGTWNDLPRAFDIKANRRRVLVHGGPRLPKSRQSHSMRPGAKRTLLSPDPLCELTTYRVWPDLFDRTARAAMTRPLSSRRASAWAPRSG